MEKNIKLDEPIGFSQNAKPSRIEDFKPVDQTKKSSRSRRKDRR